MSTSVAVPKWRVKGNDTGGDEACPPSREHIPLRRAAGMFDGSSSRVGGMSVWLVVGGGGGG